MSSALNSLLCGKESEPCAHTEKTSAEEIVGYFYVLCVILAHLQSPDPRDTSLAVAVKVYSDMTA